MFFPVPGPLWLAVFSHQVYPNSYQMTEINDGYFPTGFDYEIGSSTVHFWDEMT